MKFFREFLQFIYQGIIVCLSLFCYSLFCCIWGITYPIYWIIRLIKSLFSKQTKETKSVVITGAGSGMGQMICVQYAKKV